MALVNIQGEVEDKIFVLFGGSMLYVLRPKDDKYILIGECYVHGLMDGEAMRYLREGLVSEEDIFIVWSCQYARYIDCYIDPHISDE